MAVESDGMGLLSCDGMDMPSAYGIRLGGKLAVGLFICTLVAFVLESQLTQVPRLAFS